MYRCNTPLCNGSTTGFDPVSRGSNPRGVTTLIFPLIATLLLYLSVSIIELDTKKLPTKFAGSYDFCTGSVSDLFFY